MQRLRRSAHSPSHDGAAGRVGRVLALALITTAASVQAQAPVTGALTLDAALSYAAEHYPSIRVALEEVTANAAGVDAARTAYLPRLDAVWQTNRATVNNVTGVLMPQSVVPAISGPPLAATSSQSVWGSAVGALFSWEPVDLGLRGASVREAEAAVARARAGQGLTRLEVQSVVGAAFLTVVSAQQAIVAADADVERRSVLARVAQTLADNQLRPGADASRADAERAAAETRAIRARQGLAVAQADLTRVLGLTAGPVVVSTTGLFERSPDALGGPIPAADHPLAQVQHAAVSLAHAKEEVLASTNRPRLYLQSSLYARGSGANPDGSLDEGTDGLGPNRANWAAGVQVVVPNLFEFASLRARRAASAAATRAEQARYDEALLSVTSQQQTADALLQASRAIAANTPVQLAAARQSETQARARYEAGLASLTELAEAQSLLAVAEYHDAAAQVDVWRALLARAVAAGDLAPLVEQVRAAGVK